MKRTALLMLALLLLLAPIAAQTVSNVRVDLEPSCGYYIITYDLSGKDGEQYQLKVVPYDGSKELASPKFISGQGIDISVTAGKNYQFFWHPILEGVGAGKWQFRISTSISLFVKVEGGSFMMGSTDGDSDEKPVHQVTVSSFMIGKYELSVAEFRAFVNATSYKTTAEIYGGAWIWNGKKWETKADANWKNPYLTQTDEHPVTCISWYDALAYCNWRSRKDGFNPCYSISGNTAPADWSKGTITCDWNANGYRLPTEAEWEFAARGGTKSKGYTYSGSNDLGSVAWYFFNSGSTTHSAGSKSPNELGIYDMTGNVWEWCWDWYDDGYYAESRSLDPKGSGAGSYRVMRGGSWFSFDFFCRVADRGNFNPDFSSSYLGLRVLRAIF